MNQPDKSKDIDRFIKLLPSANVHTRKDIVVALGKLGDSRAVPALIDTFRYEVTDLETDIEGWQLAASALAKLGEASLKPLMEALADQCPNVRSWAAVALGELGDTRAVSQLIGRLNDENHQVQ